MSPGISRSKESIYIYRLQLTGDRRQTKQFCFLDADCLEQSESDDLLVKCQNDKTCCTCISASCQSPQGAFFSSVLFLICPFSQFALGTCLTRCVVSFCKKCQLVNWSESFQTQTSK